MQASWPEAKVILDLSIGRHLTEQLVFGFQPARVHIQYVGLLDIFIGPRSPGPIFVSGCLLVSELRC